ncbi:MAG: glycosyl hydrolase, partial [Gemmatimonadota bacterium]
ESWTEISRGFEPEHFVRVVREDPVRRGLLYAGTEQGVYVSFDDGGNWQSLQLDLPRTYITDLQIQPDRNDLVASTGGRGFWILDDLSVLQQADAPQEADIHLFRNRHAYRVAGGWGGGRGTAVGENPPDGAVIDFWLAEAPGDDEPVTLEILDREGTRIRRYSTDPDVEAGDERLPVSAGMNRHVWNLRHPDMVEVPGLYIWGSTAGRRVVPGTYTVRLAVGGDERTVPLEVRADPRLDTPQADFVAQDRILQEIASEITAMHQGVNQRIRWMRCWTGPTTSPTGRAWSGCGSWGRRFGIP